MSRKPEERTPKKKAVKAAKAVKVPAPKKRRAALVEAPPGVV